MSVIHQQENWIGKKPNNIGPGDKFVQCWFSQYQKSDIFGQHEGLIFLDCTLINCVLYPDMKIDCCNTAIISFEETEDDHGNVEYKFKKSKGKRRGLKVQKKERQLILSSEFITNKNVKKYYKNEIKEAIRDLKIKRV